MENNNKDMVNHPDHYQSGNIECIDAIADAISELKGIEAFDTGNCIKYLWRWRKKNGVEDLKKTRWYLCDLIHRGIDHYNGRHIEVLEVLTGELGIPQIISHCNHLRFRCRRLPAHKSPELRCSGMLWDQVRQAPAACQDPEQVCWHRSLQQIQVQVPEAWKVREQPGTEARPIR